MTKHLDQAIEQFEHAANEAAVSSWYAHMAQGFAAYMEHLRATATPHVSVPALPIDAEDERVVDELFAKRAEALREEKMPGEAGPTEERGQELFRIAGRHLQPFWDELSIKEREDWDRAYVFAFNRGHEAGKQSAADEIAALTDRIRTIADEACGMQPVISADDALTLLEHHIHSLHLAAELAQLREPTQREGDAHEPRHDQSMGASHGAGECFVPAGGWTGRRCRVCNRWVWGGPTACIGCAALAEKDRRIEELEDRLSAWELVRRAALPWLETPCRHHDDNQLIAAFSQLRQDGYLSEPFRPGAGEEKG